MLPALRRSVPPTAGAPRHWSTLSQHAAGVISATASMSAITLVSRRGGIAPNLCRPKHGAEGSPWQSVHEASLMSAVLDVLHPAHADPVAPAELPTDRAGHLSSAGRAIR